jgi:opacity protein-like surface antigen
MGNIHAKFALMGILYLMGSLICSASAEMAYQIKLETDTGQSQSDALDNSGVEEAAESVPLVGEPRDVASCEPHADAPAKDGKDSGRLDDQEKTIIEKVRNIGAGSEPPKRDIKDEYQHADILSSDSREYLPSAEWRKFHDKWIAGHLAIGLRMINYEFERGEGSSEDDEYFIGSIDSLKEEDAGFGLHNINIVWFPFADSREWASEPVRDDWNLLFAVIEGMGIEITWDELRGKTWTSLSEEDTRAYTDGTIVAEGMMLSIVFNIENSTPVTPYFGFGTADYSDLSVTKGWWHYGFGGSNPEEAYQEWRDAGSPKDPNNGYRRTFNVDSSKGSFWYVGARLEVYENWSLDLFYRETEVEFDNTYTLSIGDSILSSRNSKWDLSNTTYGIGIKYSF